MDEVLIANLPPTKTPVTPMRFQIVPFSYRCVFKSIHFGFSIQMFAFSSSFSSFPCEQEVKTQRYRNGALGYLPPRIFCIDVTILCEFENDKI